MHIKGTELGASRWIGQLRSLFQAFEIRDPPPNRQAAATPDLLQEVDKLLEPLGNAPRHTANLITGAYFLAMRACEICHTENRGRIRLLTVGSFIFQTSNKREINQRDPDLEKKAQFVTVCYIDQKNGKK